LQSAAVRERIQSSAEHYNLRHTPFDGSGQSILSEARPHSDENSHPSAGWVLPSLANDRFRIFPQDAQSKRVSEDAPVL